MCFLLLRWIAHVYPKLIILWFVLVLLLICSNYFSKRHINPFSVVCVTRIFSWVWFKVFYVPLNAWRPRGLEVREWIFNKPFFTLLFSHSILTPHSKDYLKPMDSASKTAFVMWVSIPRCAPASQVICTFFPFSWTGVFEPWEPWSLETAGERRVSLSKETVPTTSKKSLYRSSIFLSKEAITVV